MSQKTNAAETLVLKWLLTAESVTRPAGQFMALHSANPTETGAVGELSGGGYARQAVSFTVNADQASNTNTISFGPATGENWQAASHFTIWSAATGGVPLYYGDIVDPEDGITPMPITVIVNGRAEFAPGDLVITEA